MMLPFTMWLWRTSGIMMQPPHCVGLQLDYRAENTGDDSVAFFNVASGGIVRDSNIRWLIYSCFVHCNWFFFLQWLLCSRNSALQFSDNPAWGEIYWKRSKLLTFDQTWLLHSGTKVKFDLKENKFYPQLKNVANVIVFFRATMWWGVLSSLKIPPIFCLTGALFLNIANSNQQERLIVISAIFTTNIIIIIRNVHFVHRGDEDYTEPLISVV